MAELRDLDEFFDDSLKLPIGGKTYVVPGPDADTGLLCQRLMAAGITAAQGGDLDAAQLDDAGEIDLYARVLGPVYQELLADKVTWPRIKHAGTTAFLWIAADLDTAMKFWEMGPEAEAPDRKAAANSTPRRGSTSGTSRTRSTKQAAKRSAGTTS